MLFVDDGFEAIGLSSSLVGDFQMSADEYYVDGSTFYPPWRARLGLNHADVTADVEASYLQLTDSSHWLQVSVQSVPRGNDESCVVSLINTATCSDNV